MENSPCCLATREGCDSTKAVANALNLATRFFAFGPNSSISGGATIGECTGMSVTPSSSFRCNIRPAFQQRLVHIHIYSR